MSEAVSDVQVVTSENRAEFMAQRMSPAPAPEAVAEPSPAPAPTPAPAPPEPKAGEEAPEPPPEPRHENGIEKRFSKMAQQRDAAQARAEAAERRAAELEAKLLPPPEPVKDANAKPDPKDFSDAFEYAEKLADWSANKALRDRDAAEAAKAAERTAAEIKDAWIKRAAEVEKEHPDYKEVLASSELKVSDQVRDALMESEHGPRILYDLAQDPELVERLAKMTVIGALRTIGKLEAKYEKAASDPTPAPSPVPAPAPATRPKPPEPITPIRTGASGTDSKIDAAGNFTGTYEEFKALSLAGKLK